MIVKFENVELNVVENSQHEWLLETALVAEGYGVSEKKRFIAINKDVVMN